MPRWIFPALFVGAVLLFLVVLPALERATAPALSVVGEPPLDPAQPIGRVLVWVRAARGARSPRTLRVTLDGTLVLAGTLSAQGAYWHTFHLKTNLGPHTVGLGGDVVGTAAFELDAEHPAAWVLVEIAEDERGFATATAHVTRTPPAR